LELGGRTPRYQQPEFRAVTPARISCVVWPRHGAGAAMVTGRAAMSGHERAIAELLALVLEGQAVCCV